MDGLLMAETEKPAPKKKAKKKAKRAAGGAAKGHGINVHVNVVNQAGDGHKKSVNPADDALRNLRGY